MAAKTLTWVNIFARDIDELSRFYMSLFGFVEVPEMRNLVFCGISTGASNIGFMAPDVYGILKLDVERRDDGSRFLLNFEVDSVDEVEHLTKVGVERGARLVKDPAETSYGWFQSVLLDPEGNVFRINKMLANTTGDG
jgi:predicted enzyme related to lactoylglutathione lyase